MSSRRFKVAGPRSYANCWDIGDQCYQLKFVQKLPDDDLGICDPSSNTCYIKLGQSKKEIFKTFVHEMLHAMEASYDFELPHDFIDALEESVSDFIIDNRYELAEILYPKKR